MRAILALASTLLAGAACAQDLEADALSLPGAAPQAAQASRPWQLFVEAAAGRARTGGAAFVPQSLSTQRMSLDLQVDATLVPGLRGILADRLDVDWRHRFGQRHDVNTLKEAYLSWQPWKDFIVDAGRVNQYSGVAIGYNPTDFFRGGALRSLVSLDPASITKDRQGSVMLRAQALWDDASLTALYSPALREQPNPAAFNLDLGATNARDRALLIFSKRLGADLNPQWLLYKDGGASPQVGMNLTRLLNDATVAYVEWAGGRTRPLLAQALGQDGGERFRNRLSTGLTYTTSNKLSLNLEYEYNGTGLDRQEWQALPRQSLPAYLRYRQFAQSEQEMPTRHAAFVYATWQDLGISHLDLAAMVRRNGVDHSRIAWLELRYRWMRDEVALQWQSNRGGLFSDYGASPIRQAWQLSYRHFY